jgi:hypothetical protein
MSREVYEIRRARRSGIVDGQVGVWGRAGVLAWTGIVFVVGGG